MQQAGAKRFKFSRFTAFFNGEMFGEDHGMLASGPDLKIHETDLSVGLKLGEFPEESLFLASLKAVQSVFFGGHPFSGW